MGTVWFVLGAALVLLVLVDAVWTTMATTGAGPVAYYVSDLYRRAVLLIHRRFRTGRRLLACTGPVVMMLIIFVWLALLWLGWFVLFCGDPSQIVDARTQQPADALSRFYYTGFCVSTLGLGDYVPASGLFRVLAVIASINGMLILTLVISYALSVVTAVAEKRRLAGYVFNLGQSPGDILRNAWNGRDFSGLDSHLIQLASMMEMHAQRHLVFPVLHYFHSRDRHTSATVATAILGELILLLGRHSRPDLAPPPAVLRPLENSMVTFLKMVQGKFIAGSLPPPPPTSSQPLRDLGAQADQERPARELLLNHRDLLLALVRSDGWTWQDVVDPQATGQDEHAPQ